MKIFCKIFIALLAGFSANLFSGELKVVSLSPALTEMICYLGGEKYLVGRCSACDYPARVKALPVAGKFGMPEIEKIAAMKPDWVIGNSFANTSAVKKLRQLGIETDLAQISTPEDYISWLQLIGKKFDEKTLYKAANALEQEV